MYKIITKVNSRLILEYTWQHQLKQNDMKRKQEVNEFHIHNQNKKNHKTSANIKPYTALDNNQQ